MPASDIMGDRNNDTDADQYREWQIIIMKIGKAVQDIKRKAGNGNQPAPEHETKAIFINIFFCFVDGFGNQLQALRGVETGFGCFHVNKYS